MRLVAFLLLVVSFSEADTLVRIRSVTAHAGGSEFSIDPALQDIAGQLKELPFKTFKLVEERTGRFDMKSKGTLKFASGDKVQIRPLYEEDGKVCLWFRWTDSGGEQVLDTRLHVEPGTSILAGTESSNEKALVFAVGVER
jgi:hypothetical protein